MLQSAFSSCHMFVEFAGKTMGPAFSEVFPSFCRTAFVDEKSYSTKQCSVQGVLSSETPILSCVDTDPVLWWASFERIS
jgi:hypothetical protein